MHIDQLTCYYIVYTTLQQGHCAFCNRMDTRIHQQSTDLKSEISRELALQLQPMASAVAKTESSIEHLQKDIAELALTVEMLQAT